MEQRGLCKICGKPDPSGILRADHRHEDKKRRSLLCNKCNMALGLFGEDAELIKRASEYLEAYV